MDRGDARDELVDPLTRGAVLQRRGTSGVRGNHASDERARKRRRRRIPAAFSGEMLLQRIERHAGAGSHVVSSGGFDRLQSFAQLLSCPVYVYIVLENDGYHG